MRFNRSVTEIFGSHKPNSSCSGAAKASSHERGKLLTFIKLQSSYMFSISVSQIAGGTTAMTET